MTSYALYRIATDRHPQVDSLRTLFLTLVAVAVAIALGAAIPDAAWSELSSSPAYGLAD